MKFFIKTLVFFFASIQVFYGQSMNWTTQSSPSTQNLYGVAYSDTSLWVAVGSSGTIIRSVDGGVNWALISSPVNDQLRGVSFLGHLGLAVGISGRVLRTTDGGLNWTEEIRPTTRNLYSVSISSYMAVITGEEGTILVSVDSGLTWTPHTAGTASVLFGVSVNDSTAVGVGGQGAVVMSVNGGNGWGLTILGGQQVFFYSTSFVTGSTGWAVGSTAAPAGNVIIISTDYGFVWSAQTAPTTEQLFGVSFSSLLSGCAVGTNGAIIYTNDSGNTWLNISSGTTQTLSSVSFVNPSRGIAVGDGGTILRTDSGVPLKVDQPGSIASNFALEQNYPNPFNPVTSINYQLPQTGFVTLKIYNILGKEVATLVNEEKSAGNYTVKFDGTGIPSGVYLYQLRAGSSVELKKMILLK